MADTKEKKKNIFKRITGLWRHDFKNGSFYLRSCAFDRQAWEAIQAFGDDMRLEIRPNRKGGGRAPTHTLFAMPVGKTAEIEKEALKD